MRRKDRHRGAAVATAAAGGRRSECRLSDARRGERFEVLDVGDDRARTHALRFGIAEGATVSCITRIPAGPIVVRSGRQEIAVGRGLARRIAVRLIEGGR